MDKDQKPAGGLNPGTLGWLWNMAAGCRRYLVALTALQIAVALGSVGYALLFRALIDSAVAGSREGFISALCALVALAAAQLLARTAVRHLEEKSRARVENAAKSRLFATLLGKAYADVTAVHTARWMNLLTGDTVVVAEGMTQILPNVAGMGVRMAGAFAAIVALQPLFGLILIPVGLVCLGTSRVLRPVLKGFHGQIQEADAGVRQVLQERLDDLLIVRSFSRPGASEALARERMDAHEAARMKRSRVSNLSTLGFGVAIQGIYLTGACVCGLGILEGTLSYGTMTAVLQLVGQLQNPLSRIGGYGSQWYAMQASAERLMAAESLPDDPAGDICPEKSLGFYRDGFLGLRAEGLGFSYGEDGAAVRDVELLLDKGEFVALVGPSGCGKSTLLKLLMGLYPPDAGALRVVTARGVRDLEPGDRGLFAYVPQGNHLMSGTVREAVAFYDPEAMKQESRIWEALTAACADGFVAELPLGLDTPLGEHGSGLSEGQLQRLSVARAVFSRRPILLLDESTSALDEDTEAKLLDNLKTMTDRTVLIVTHRSRACTVCHRVVHLN